MKLYKSDACNRLVFSYFERLVLKDYEQLMMEYTRVVCPADSAEHDSGVCICTAITASEAIEELEYRRDEWLEELPTTELEELYLSELGDAVTVVDDDTDDCDVVGSNSASDAPEDPAFYLSHQPVSIASTTNEAESTRVGQVVMATIKQCWFNARRVVLKLDEYADASYVEGWVVLDDGLWIEHGWVVRDGTVIDPTLTNGVAAYFPGLEFRGRRAIEAFLASPRGKECRWSPFFFAYGWGGMNSPGIRKAHDDARHFAEVSFGNELESVTKRGSGVEVLSTSDQSVECNSHCQLVL